MIGVCLKWVERRPEVDPLTGEVATDPRSSGASEADQAALEWALRLAKAWDDEVIAVTAGPREAEPVLREALAAGAATAVRVDLPAGAASAAVAAGLAGALRGATAVVCGDWSLDRGSGSVPAFLAAHLDAAQALGLVDLDPAEPGLVRAQRRLDGGRRERVTVAASMVLSVEGRERLRRAHLNGVLVARTTPIDVRAAPPTLEHAPVRTGAYRPRARVLAPPRGESARERVLALTGALVDRTPPERVVLDPAPAADRLLAQLRAWGYLDE
jgi:electron transfer flavoprotein beta subunit